MRKLIFFTINPVPLPTEPSAYWQFIKTVEYVSISEILILLSLI